MNFVDREVQYPNRKKLTVKEQSVNLNGETELVVDVLRQEGNIIEEGTQLNAENLNQNNNELTSQIITLGETSSTAYRGDRGKTAYDHSQVSHAPSNAQKNSDITKSEIESKLTGTISTHTHTIPNANSTTVGGLKVRVSGTTLYITNDGTTP